MRPGPRWTITAAIVLASGVAVAAPDAGSNAAARPKIPAGPSPAIAVEAIPAGPLPEPVDLVPDVRGGKVISRLIEPPANFGDARPYPYGAVIQPPDVGDDNAAVIGTTDLPDSRPLSGRLAGKLDAGVGAILGLLFTPRFVGRT